MYIALIELRYAIYFVDDGIRVLEAGCGLGIMTLMLAEKFTQSTFIGCDLSPDVVRTANQKVNKKGLQNITFEAGDVSQLLKI